MRLDVRYTTAYTYSQPARRVIQLLRLTPQSFPGQHVLDWRVDVDQDAKLREHRDGYGNVTHMLYIDRMLDELNVSIRGNVLTEDLAGVVAGIQGDLPPRVFCRETTLTHAGPPLLALAERLKGQAGEPLARLHWLMEHIHTDLKFDTEQTGTDTSATEAYSAGHGVCQDFAHIFIAVARAAGMPARYVSGHLFRRDGVNVQEAAHAWAEAWVPDVGWVAFDPTNGICADDAYIRVACGLDYRDAAPFAGARRGGGEERLDVQVEVRLARGQAQSQGPGATQSQTQA